MSTRAHIIIEGCKAMLYRHCDGYPGDPLVPDSGVLCELIPFLGKFMEHRGWDPEYMLARLCQSMCSDHDGFTGYGIADSMHGDVEYIYVVTESRKVLVKATTGAFWDRPILSNTKLESTHEF